MSEPLDPREIFDRQVEELMVMLGESMPNASPDFVAGIRFAVLSMAAFIQDAMETGEMRLTAKGQRLADQRVADAQLEYGVKH